MTDSRESWDGFLSPEFLNPELEAQLAYFEKRFMEGDEDALVAGLMTCRMNDCDWPQWIMDELKMAIEFWLDGQTKSIQLVSKQIGRMTAMMLKHLRRPRAQPINVGW